MGETARIVVCGNMQPVSGDDMEPRALAIQQADATTVRVVLRLAAYWGWSLGLLEPDNLSQCAYGGA